MVRRYLLVLVWSVEVLWCAVLLVVIVAVAVPLILSRLALAGVKKRLSGEKEGEYPCR